MELIKHQLKNKSDFLVAIKNEFISTSYVDIADMDYLKARLAYKYNLQYMWDSLQCIEKYIKAILLYNDYSTIKVGHKINEGIELISIIPNLNININKEDKAFIEYLCSYGNIESRYNQIPNRSYNGVKSFKDFDDNGYFNYLKIDCNFLNRLDSLVWNIRRYCSSKCYTNRDHIKSDQFKQNIIPEFGLLRKIILCKKENLCEFIDSYHYNNYDGSIEKVDSILLEQRDILTWNNIHFPYGNKKNINFKSAEIFQKDPPHLRFPKFMEDEWFKNVKIDKNFREQVEKDLGIKVCYENKNK
jgi:hypothetical protein